MKTTTIGARRGPAGAVAGPLVGGAVDDDGEGVDGTDGTDRPELPPLPPAHAAQSHATHTMSAAVPRTS